MAPSHDQPPRRILVFGGTFDPPHLAHAKLPAQAASLLNADLLLYVPTAINPLKTSGPIAPPEHRLAMLLLAIADIPNARISTVELDRARSGDQPSYTIDTLRDLQREFALNGEHAPPKFFLLIGSDQALDFHRWKDWREILAIATPAVMLRPPHDATSFRRALQAKYDEQEVDEWISRTLRLPRLDISATELRHRLEANDRKGLRDWLAPAVLEYALTNRLYARSAS